MNGVEVVWLSDWEMQCCGDSFSVDEKVVWRLSPVDDRTGLAEILGDAVSAAITSYYDHHSEGPRPREVEGVVRSIQAVHCEYRECGQMDIPVSGSAVLSPRSTASGWEDEPNVVRFVGYLVDLDTAP